MLCQSVRATSIAAKLRQLGAELVTVVIPETATGGAQAVIRMLNHGGRDQIAMHLQTGGWNGFEFPMPSLFAACVDAFPGTTLDVGANTGFYAVVAAAVNPSTTIIAFEPFPPVARDLRSTLELNDCASRVTVEGVAVSDHIGDAQLFIPLQDHGLIETSATLSGDFKESYSESLSVAVTTLDAYDESHAFAPVSVIKVDVESFEAQVLYGATQIVRRDRPIIFCEVLPQGDASRVDAFRVDHDYVDVRLHATDAVIGETVRFDDLGWNHALGAVGEDRRRGRSRAPDRPHRAGRSLGLRERAADPIAERRRK